MILVDANLLLYAVVSDYPQHVRARSWLDDQLNAPHRFGLPWPSILAFLRICTNPRVFPNPLAMGDAWSYVASWLDLPTVWQPVPGVRHAQILGELLNGGAGTPALVADAHLAALAIEHGLTLCSSDGDFARFDGLRWENPIA